MTCYVTPYYDKFDKVSDGVYVLKIPYWFDGAKDGEYPTIEIVEKPKRVDRGNPDYIYLKYNLNKVYFTIGYYHRYENGKGSKMEYQDRLLTITKDTMEELIEDVEANLETYLIQAFEKDCKTDLQGMLF